MPLEQNIILTDEVINNLFDLGRKIVVNKFRLDIGTAEDIVQNALLKAWRNIDSFRHDCTVSTWFYKIVVRESLMYIRKEKKNSVLLPILDVILSDGNHHQERILKKIENRTRLEVVEQATKHLNRKEQKCIDEFYFQEKTLKEISEGMDVKLGTVKAYINRGKKKIREECLVTV